MNKQKGFTIIELIVVIAIIAVLAAIVLVNVTQYIARSRDAAIKGNMATIATNAAVFFDGNNTYIGDPTFVSGASYTQPAAAIGSAGGTMGTPNASASAFCVSATLTNGTDTWCVDSTGYKGALTTGACTGTSYTCTVAAGA